MRACRRRGARFQPHLWVNLHMRKPLRNFSQMCVEPLIPASVVPGRGDLLWCIAEDGAESLCYLDIVTKRFLNCIDAGLWRICPDAQNIREIFNLDLSLIHI